MFDPESWDMYHCHPYLFIEICIPLENKPIRSFWIQHLKKVSFARLDMARERGKPPACQCLIVCHSRC